MEYYIVKWNDKNEMDVYRNWWTGEPYPFFEPIVPAAIAQGMRYAGLRAEVITIDPRYEELTIPAKAGNVTL